MPTQAFIAWTISSVNCPFNCNQNESQFGGKGYTQRVQKKKVASLIEIRKDRIQSRMSKTLLRMGLEFATSRIGVSNSALSTTNG